MQKTTIVKIEQSSSGVKAEHETHLEPNERNQQEEDEDEEEHDREEEDQEEEDQEEEEEEEEKQEGTQQCAFQEEKAKAQILQPKPVPAYLGVEEASGCCCDSRRRTGRRSRVAEAPVPPACGGVA
jgi:hypothetical protein